MPLQLDTPQAVSATIDSYEITAFSADLATATMHVVYERRAGGSKISEGALSISAQDYADAIARADEVLAGMSSPSVYDAIKVALYERVMAAEGITGAVI